MADRHPSAAPERSAERPRGRRYPIGVELLDRSDGTRCAHARAWAPDRGTVEVLGAESDATSWRVSLGADGHGYHAGWLPELKPGGRYRFVIDGQGPYPDPVSRFQPDGPHGPSVLIDPLSFQWSDRAWRGVALAGQVLYETHIGTFTPEGTYAAARQRLPHLRDLGVTCIELMPLPEFAGRFGWGYDGVDLFAPSHLYGTPDDLRELVNAAHGSGIAVILDVVYNHLGPDGNYLRQVSGQYFGSKRTEWGDALNFDEEGAAGVREYVLVNVAYWAEEFHIDGFRLDATQQIYDASTPHILADIARTVRELGDGRSRIVLAENEPESATLVRSPSGGGYGLDGLWNDDFHHSALVAAIGRNEAYYTDFRGSPQELVSAAKYGFLFQGQWFSWQHNRRGSPGLDLEPAQFVACLENHDQIANSRWGKRLHQETSPGRLRALTALLLLLPHTPMLFQGQEFGSSSPWFYFADHHAELAPSVRTGRRRFLLQFAGLASDDERFADPGDEKTFEACRLQWRDLDTHQPLVSLHRDLIRLRRSDPVFSVQRRRGLDGAVLNDHAFVIRFYSDANDDRLLVVNLGPRCHPNDAEPLLASPTRLGWNTVLSTDDPRYDGWGTTPLETPKDGWWLPAESATVLVPNQPNP